MLGEGRRPVAVRRSIASSVSQVNNTRVRCCWVAPARCEDIRGQEVCRGAEPGGADQVELSCETRALVCSNGAGCRRLARAAMRCWDQALHWSHGGLAPVRARCGTYLLQLVIVSVRDTRRTGWAHYNHEEAGCAAIAGTAGQLDIRGSADTSTAGGAATTYNRNRRLRSGSCCSLSSSAEGDRDCASICAALGVGAMLLRRAQPVVPSSVAAHGQAGAAGLQVHLGVADPGAGNVASKAARVAVSPLRRLAAILASASVQRAHTSARLSTFRCVLAVRSVPRGCRVGWARQWTQG
jgi:hypothetical protein